MSHNIERKNIRSMIGREWLFWDGAGGTFLQERGLKAGELPEMWNIQRPDEILEMSRSYYGTGCNIVNTNTFGANRLKYPDELEAIVRSAVELAVSARNEAEKKTGRDDLYVSLDIGPTGRLLKPLGDLDFEEAVRVFGEVVRIGADAGADLVLIETMSDTYELKAAVLAAKENSDLPVCATVTFDSGRKLLTGADVKTCVALLEGLGVDALGVNCSLGPREILPIVRELVDAASIPVIITPNAGMPKNVDGTTVYDIGPEEFSDLMGEIAGMGVQIMGGCCGTTPEHIRLTVEKCRELPFKPATRKNHTVVTSYARAVEIGEQTLVIGERINPTGKKLFKEALKNGDIPYILNEGLKQEDQGAHILDVNVGLPEIDEVAMMEKAMTGLQSVTALPLQIDTADPDVLERALRFYNGKAMVNSVNGKEESMSRILPLVAKYGGVLVALPLDDSGIPDTAEGRLAVAKRIIEEAGKYGIDPKDIVVDGLTMTISADQTMGRVTLETIDKVRSELGLNTILGVSNVSFGLPARTLINGSFLSMTMERGLSCAIINPMDDVIMNSYRASLALLGMDENCSGYVDAYSDYKPPAPAPSGQSQVSASSGQSVGAGGQTAALGQSKNAGGQIAAGGSMSLRGCIERGLTEEAGQMAQAQLETRAPLDIINEDLIPALDSVGRGFESGEIFLPQLLMSADATNAAFAVIKKALPENSNASRGRVIVATVKGDIHDIGKNITRVLLENYGFEVIDLGRDVDPQDILDEAVKKEIKLVGLSALMTTTVPAMTETVKLLHRESPDTKVLVSGAVLNQEYADMMGADHYARDAMGTVRYAEEILG